MPYRNGKKQLKGSGWDAATMPMSVEKKRMGSSHWEAATMPTMPAARTIMGCHARPGFLVRDERGREFGAAFVHSFLNSVYNWSRDAELVSFPAFECFPGWSISRISVLSLINS